AVTLIGNPEVECNMISRRLRWFLWACVALLISAAVLSAALLGLPHLSTADWPRFWQEPHAQFVAILGPPVFTLLLVILALLAQVGESDRSSTGEIDRL